MSKSKNKNADSSQVQKQDIEPGGDKPHEVINDSTSQLILNESVVDKKESDSSVPLDASLKNQFERAFDADFSRVRIHLGQYANEITRNASADAVTVGHDIYFSDGHFRPDTDEGIQLIAHELQHVVQNQESRRMVYLEDISMLEYEAEKAADTLKEMKLHDISGPILNQSENVSPNEEQINQSMENQPQDSSAPNNAGGSKDNFEDFLKKPDGPTVRYHTASGETILLDLKQYRQGKEQVLKTLEILFEEKKSILPLAVYEAELLRFVEYMNKM